MFKSVVSARNFTVWTNKTFDHEGHKYLLKLASTIKKSIHQKEFEKNRYGSPVSSASKAIFTANLVVENVLITPEDCLLFAFFLVDDMAEVATSSAELFTETGEEEEEESAHLKIET